MRYLVLSVPEGPACAIDDMYIDDENFRGHTVCGERYTVAALDTKRLREVSCEKCFQILADERNVETGPWQIK